MQSRTLLLSTFDFRFSSYEFFTYDRTTTNALKRSKYVARHKKQLRNLAYTYVSLYACMQVYRL